MGEINTKTATKVKKVINVVLNALLYLFMALCVVMIVLSVTTKKSDTGVVTVLGYQMKVVETPSMEWQEDIKLEHLGLETDEIKSLDDLKIKDIPRYSMVFIEVVPSDPEVAKEWYKGLKVGDVLTFMYGEYGVISGRQPIITHRITSITEKAEGRFMIELNGDNKGISDEDKVSPADTLTQVIDTGAEGVNYVLGKVTGQSKLLGNVVNIVHQPVGMVFIVIVPCVIILIMEIIKIVGYFTSEKKKKEQEEKEEQQNEIEQLKKELEMLKKANETEKPADVTEE